MITINSELGLIIKNTADKQCLCIDKDNTMPQQVTADELIKIFLLRSYQGLSKKFEQLASVMVRNPIPAIINDGHSKDALADGELKGLVDAGQCHEGWTLLMYVVERGDEADPSYTGLIKFLLKTQADVLVRHPFCKFH